MKKSIMEFPYMVTNPRQVTWAVRFSSEEAAWNRLLTLKHMTERPDAKEHLISLGWRIINLHEREATSAPRPRRFNGTRAISGRP